MSNDQQGQGGSGGEWQSSTPSAGWYQDPWDSHRRRYWDGQQWTGDVSFEPPRNWGEQGGASQPQAPGQQQSYGHPQQEPTYQQPSAPAQPQSPAVQPHPPARQAWGGGYQAQPVAPQWPAATQEYPTQTGWGGWGQPPQVPAGPYAGGMWQQPQPAQRANRVHVAIVAVIAAIAVLAGIGIGSQVNASSSSTAAGASGGSAGGAGSGGVTNPFGGGSSGSTSGGASGSTSLSSAQKAIVTRIDKSVVDVNTDLGYQDGAAAGTGMVLTSNGLILTNNHVIDGATSITATVVTTGKTYKATVVGTDVTQDVAVIQMQDVSGLTPISIGNSSTVTRGDSVIAIGNAGGAGGLPSAVSGSVSALDQTITASDSNGANSEVLNGLIQDNAPIQAGDSGGPLVNTKGQVIGMDTAASSTNAVDGSNSVGFAIPMASATTIAAQIRDGKATSKVHIGATGFLGVSVSTGSSSTGLPGSLGSGLGQNGGSAVAGASVAEVIPDSPAQKAGIVAGDTITGVDGTAIASATALTATLRVHHPGDQVSVTWVDVSGTSHTATVTLTVGPAA